MYMGIATRQDRRNTQFEGVLGKRTPLLTLHQAIDEREIDRLAREKASRLFR